MVAAFAYTERTSLKRVHRRCGENQRNIVDDLDSRVERRFLADSGNPSVNLAWRSPPRSCSCGRHFPRKLFLKFSQDLRRTDAEHRRRLTMQTLRIDLFALHIARGDLQLAKLVIQRLLRHAERLARFRHVAVVTPQHVFD